MDVRAKSIAMKKSSKSSKQKDRDRRDKQSNSNTQQSDRHTTTASSSLSFSSSFPPSSSSSSTSKSHSSSKSKSKSSSSKSSSSTSAANDRDIFSLALSSPASNNHATGQDVIVQMNNESASPISKSSSPLLFNSSTSRSNAPGSIASHESSYMDSFRHFTPLRLIIVLSLICGIAFFLYQSYLPEGQVENTGDPSNVNTHTQTEQPENSTGANQHPTLTTIPATELPIPTETNPTTIPTATTTTTEEVTPPPTATISTPPQTQDPIPAMVDMGFKIPQGATPPAVIQPVAVATPTPVVEAPPVLHEFDPDAVKIPVPNRSKAGLPVLSEKVFETGEGIQEFFSLDLEPFFTKLYGENALFDRQEAEMRELKLKEKQRRIKEHILLRPLGHKRARGQQQQQASTSPASHAAPMTFRRRALIDPGALERARLAKEAQVQQERNQRANARETERMQQQQQQLLLQQQLRIPASADLPFKLTIGNLADKSATNDPQNAQPKEFGA